MYNIYARRFLAGDAFPMWWRPLGWQLQRHRPSKEPLSTFELLHHELSLEKKRMEKTSTEEKEPVRLKIDYEDIRVLTGRLLTYVDATYSDKEQRDAHKRLIKRITYGFYSEKGREQFPDIDWFDGIPID